MKRFAFTLRPVAVLREHRELRAREAFAASIQALDRAGRKHEQARHALTQFAESITAGRSGRSVASTQVQVLTGYRHQGAVEADAARAVAAARAAMEQQRLAHRETHRQLEMIRRLEAKARTAHRAATARLEQAELDDLSLRRQAACRLVSRP